MKFSYSNNIAKSNSEVREENFS